MANRFAPADILSTYAAIEAIKDNFNSIANMLDLCVFRDGSGNNSMLANLDLNTNRIVNVGNAIDNSDAPNLAQVQSLVNSIPKGAKGDPGPAGLYFATRTALKAYTTHNDYDRVGITEYGFEGDVVFLSAATFASKTGLTLTTVVTDDTTGAFVIPPAADTTGASGAWVRQGILLPKHFGCASNGTTNDVAALTAAGNLIIKYPSLRHDLTGTFGISSVFAFGPSSAASPPPIEPIVGRIKLVALASMLELAHIKNLSYRKWLGGVWTQGTGTTSFSSRTCAVGIYWENCARLQLTMGTRHNSLSVAGNYFGTANNNLMDMGYSEGINIASGHANGYGLTGNWSNPVNSGSSGSTSQTTVINLDTIFSSTLDPYLTPSNGNPVHLRIGGYLYSVRSVDRVGGTATVYPWVDTGTLGTSGTYEWVFGGINCFRGSDANLIRFSTIDSNNCGRALAVGSPYGPIVDNIQANVCGTIVCIGSDNTAACMGTTIRNFYAEGSTANQEHVVINTAVGTSFHGIVFGDNGGFDLAKCWAVADPRATAGQIVGGELGLPNNGAFSIFKGGRLFQPWKQNINRGPGSSINLDGQTDRPVPKFYARDSHTCNLKVLGAGEYNRLFGFDGGLIGYVGSGTNLAPTGSIVFVPPSGGTINGGAVDATLTFTGFDGPVLFKYIHTDNAQLTWKVKPLCGQTRNSLAALGYSTGAGGTVTQVTSKAQGVTLNKLCGQITTHNASLAADTSVAFVLTNSTIAAGDIVLINHTSGGTLGAYGFAVATASGSATITIHNNTPGALAEALVLNYAVIKATTS